MRFGAISTGLAPICRVWSGGVVSECDETGAAHSGASAAESSAIPVPNAAAPAAVPATWETDDGTRYYAYSTIKAPDKARSVVQVHPGPPSKSPVNTRLFSLFPFGEYLSKEQFANYLPTLRLAGWRYTEGVKTSRGEGGTASID